MIRAPNYEILRILKRFNNLKYKSYGKEIFKADKKSPL